MKSTSGEKIFYTINYIVLTLIAISCLLPLIHIFSVAFSDGRAVASGDVSLYPINFTTFSIERLLFDTFAVECFKNSVVITGVGVLLSMIGTIMIAYPLSKKNFIGRGFWSKIVVFTMFFGGGLIPWYLVLKMFNMTGNYYGLWLPGLVSTYNMLILKTFFEGIPADLEEAARIDGCSELRLLVQVFLPLSKPVLATLVLFYGVSYWNLFMPVLILITKTQEQNLAVLINNMIKSQSAVAEFMANNPDDVQSVTPAGIRSAGIVLMVVPMLVVYPFVQKYFVKGVMIGAIKG